MRLFDLHCNWALQYAGETCQCDAAMYADVSTRLGQVEGYLTGTGVAVLACGRRPEDWARQADPWKTLGEMLARYEAEFSGRLLIGPDDVTRWKAEPDDGICWGILGVEGFDALVRHSADLDRLPGLFERGVRVYQLVATDASSIGGAAVPGDDRGLTELGLAFLDRLDAIASSHETDGRRPVVDLAELNLRSTEEVLNWYESELTRPDRLPLIRSHGAIGSPSRQVVTGLSSENLRRFRALGGIVGLSPGLPFFDSPEEFREGFEAVAAIPFRGLTGYMGIGIGTDFLNLEQTFPDVVNASTVVDWLTANFATEVAALLIRGNGLGLMLRASGKC